MKVNRRKIKEMWQFRHFGPSYKTKKPGLYFGNCGSISKDAWSRISEKDVVEIRDWLSRYINEHQLKNPHPLAPEMRVKARAIIRGLEKIEADYK